MISNLRFLLINHMILWFITLSLLCARQAFGAERDIIVSIKPIHSLVCSITKGVKKPTLLLKHHSSPHHYSLTPKDIHLIKEGKLFIWAGPSYETFFKSILEKIQCSSIAILDTPNLSLLPVRGQKDNHLMDAHAWLNPDNAIKIACYLEKVISHYDPPNIKIYAHNTKILIENLKKLNKEISDFMTPYRNKRYVIYHDGLQYFDKVFGPTFLASIVKDCHHSLPVKGMLSLRSLLSNGSQKPDCIFFEETFSSRLTKELSTEFCINHVPIDYLGFSLKEGAGAYEKILWSIAHSFAEGLGK